MNDLQRVQLSILKELDKICVSYDIPYSLGYGTLLGAVRHKGFIPWDDDIDIIMMRSDFKRLESVWADVADDNLFLQTYKSDGLYPYPFAKIRDKRTTFVEEGSEHLDIAHGIFMDIFLMDYIPENSVSRFWQLFCAEMVWILSRKDIPGQGFKGIVRKCVCAIFPGGSRQSAMQKFESLTGKYGYEAAAHIANLNYGAGWRTQILPKDTFRNLDKFTFEDSVFWASKDYDEILRMRYGDYMTLPPEEMRVSGHPHTVLDIERPYTEVFKRL